jgi:hypothetical protein
VSAIGGAVLRTISARRLEPILGHFAVRCGLLGSSVRSRPAKRKGALRICNAGCKHYLLLIVSGPHAGEMWDDVGIDDLGVFPISGLAGQPMSFAVWIGERLDTIPKGDLIERFWSSYDFAGHAIAKVLASAAEPLTIVAADQLPYPTCVGRLRSLNPFPRVRRRSCAARSPA